MRKCDKVKKHCYIDNGGWRQKNVRYRYYKILHDAIMESHLCHWTPTKRYKRRAVINNTAYIPLSELIRQFDKEYNTDIWLGGGCTIPMDCVKEIRVF